MDPSSAPPPSSGSPVADRVHDLVDPVVATLGVELVDIEWTGGTLRVVVDQSGGITSGTLAEVNRLISPLLDQHDPVPGRYLLEVSSPGVERPLRTEAHFIRAIGEDVTVKLVPTVEPRRIRGRLIAVDDQRLTVEAVEIDGVARPIAETHYIELAEVAKARTVFDWDSMPKKPKKNKKKGKNRKNKSVTATSTMPAADEGATDDAVAERVTRTHPPTQDRDDGTDEHRMDEQ
jgi:ribosome maturation factor RimP